MFFLALLIFFLLWLFVLLAEPSFGLFVLLVEPSFDSNLTLSSGSCVSDTAGVTDKSELEDSVSSAAAMAGTDRKVVLLGCWSIAKKSADVAAALFSFLSVVVWPVSFRLADE